MQKKRKAPRTNKNKNNKSFFDYNQSEEYLLQIPEVIFLIFMIYFGVTIYTDKAKNGIYQKYWKNQKDDYDDEKLIPDNELTFYKYNFNLDLIDTVKISYNAKIGFDKAIKVKSKLILYGFNEMVILRGKNSSDNKKEKNMISELFE